jgi:hypothetical protein
MKKQDSLFPDASANARQVGGDHYKKAGALQHWDIVAIFELDYFQGNITKYVFRWRDKAGIQDLEKARHYLDKYIEIEKSRTLGTLTRDILHRAVRELENLEAEDDEARYRAGAKGDDPVGDALYGYVKFIRQEDLMSIVEEIEMETLITHLEVVADGSMASPEQRSDALRSAAGALRKVLALATGNVAALPPGQQPAYRAP